MMHSSPEDALVGGGAATAEQRAGSTAMRIVLLRVWCQSANFLCLSIDQQCSAG